MLSVSMLAEPSVTSTFIFHTGHMIGIYSNENKNRFANEISLTVVNEWYKQHNHPIADQYHSALGYSHEYNCLCVCMCVHA